MVSYKKLLAIDMSKLRPYSTYYPVQYDYVSQLPEGWKLLPNYAIFQERSERNKDEMELLSISISKGVIKQSDMDKKDISSQDKSNYKIVRKDDIAYGMEFRKGAVGHSIYTGKVSPVYTILKPIKKTEINQRFYHYMFRTEFYKNYIWRYVYGIGEHFLPLRYKDFKRMYSIFPPIETQNAIVEYLDGKTAQIQEFIAKKERLVELFNIQTNAQIREHVSKGIENKEYKNTEIDWIEKIPVHWNIKPLFSLFEEVKKRNDKKENYKVLSLSYGRVVYKDHESNFGLVPVNYDSYQIIEPDQFVFRFTDLQNDLKSLRVGLSKKRGIITSAYLSLKKKRSALINPDYFYYLFHFYDIEKVFYRFGGGVRQAMSINDVKRLPLLLPPINEQDDIVKRIGDIKREYSKATAKAKLEIEKAKEYQESLITQVVTGQLQVPMSELGLEGLKENRIIKSSSSGQEVLKSSNPQILISSNPKNPNPDNI